MQPSPTAPEHGRRSAARRVESTVGPTAPAPPHTPTARPRAATARTRPASARTRPATARPRHRRTSVRHQIVAAAAALGLVAVLAIAPTVRVDAAFADGFANADSDPTVAAQALSLAPGVVSPLVTRETVSATGSVQTLTINGTNADWARLVLVDGGWPQTDANVTVMLRWMRQENGPPDWWNRNNPLNNGFGSGGGSGLGSYPTLEAAAMYAAQNLQRGYPAIVAGLVSGASADVTARAIWASPWSTSHYANGAHWSTAPVPVVQAPASAW